MSDPVPSADSTSIAVIGMAGRFPGAADVDEFWANLCAGRDSVVELPPGPGGAGAPVSAYGLLDGTELFDARYFGYAPREALTMDPQHRVFLECAHQALENAGYAPGADGPDIGLFAGGSTTRHRELLEAHRADLPFVDDWQIRLGTAPDFLTARAAQRLRLKGPVACVQTACSTSLVAVHLACQALLAGECALALAGGASVHAQPPRGSYTDGGALTGDGRVRAFDARAAGTVGGGAAALLVLKPLDDALADGDRIHAVIRGSAVHNDGGDAVGFTAPSVHGQARTVRAALLAAGVDARSVEYVEAHGTGTPLGDPIEVAALTRAFRADTDDSGFCRIGSVKTNIGHTDAAAGVTGLIKAVLAVERGLIPPSLHFSEPNPEVDWASCPFTVPTELTAWPSPGAPRRAGVSAFGAGGTNAHVVIESPPARAARREDDPSPQLLVLSAPEPGTLCALSGRLADRLAADAGTTPLADVAWTLQSGRTAHENRAFCVVRDTADAVRVLRGHTPGRFVVSGRHGSGGDPVFMFPGQGSQHAGMARGLYAALPGFRRAMDECSELAEPLLGRSLSTLLFSGEREPAGTLLDDVSFSQPAVFAVEYSLYRLWRSWGVRPGAVVGHSLGAYAAAVAAGVLSLPDAVRLVVKRGALLRGVPTGSMLAVELSEKDLLPLIPDGLTLAAVNGPERCTVSGRERDVSAFATELLRRGVATRTLKIQGAGHSPLVDPVVQPFEEFVGTLSLRPPTVPFVSDLTGSWAGARELTDPAYWSAHLRRTVRFGDCLETLCAEGQPTLLELGPGRVLTSLAHQHPAVRRHEAVLSSLPHPQDDTPDHETLLTAAGRLWSTGVPLVWEALHRPGRHRAELPGHPFDRRRFGIDAAPRTVGAPAATGSEVFLGETAPRSGHDRPADSRPAPPPHRGAAAGRLGSLVAGSLGMPGVDDHDDFFALGGDSLIAARLAAAISESFGVPLEARDIFLNPTVHGLTGILHARGAAIGP
ncbi:type I polyketide synthase [Streptomyces sp. NBC_00096]|uniref:type I polyketide synthase n=1 Tax=Streptomyces sp. NBC_00096 TaxID=2975650 RepID=UPI0032540886